MGTVCIFLCASGGDLALVARASMRILRASNGVFCRLLMARLVAIFSFFTQIKSPWCETKTKYELPQLGATLAPPVSKYKREQLLSECTSNGHIMLCETGVCLTSYSSSSPAATEMGASEPSYSEDSVECGSARDETSCSEPNVENSL